MVRGEEERSFRGRMDDALMKSAIRRCVKVVLGAECLLDMDDQCVGTGRLASAGVQASMGKAIASSVR